MEKKTIKLPSVKITGSGATNGGSFEEVKILGEGTVSGDIACSRFKVTGNVRVRGGLRLEKGTLVGNALVEGDFDADEAKITGDLRVLGNCSSERLYVKGCFRIDGMLNADVLDVRLHGPARVREIGGGSLSVKPTMWRMGSPATLTVDVVEGDAVKLSYTKAGVVRGGTVAIGPGCEIGRVEYREDYRCSAKANVGESVKTGGNKP